MIPGVEESHLVTVIRQALVTRIDLMVVNHFFRKQLFYQHPDFFHPLCAYCDSEVYPAHTWFHTYTKCGLFLSAKFELFWQAKLFPVPIRGLCPRNLKAYDFVIQTATWSARSDIYQIRFCNQGLRNAYVLLNLRIDIFKATHYSLELCTFMVQQKRFKYKFSHEVCPRRYMEFILQAQEYFQETELCQWLILNYNNLYLCNVEFRWYRLLLRKSPAIVSCTGRLIDNVDTGPWLAGVFFLRRHCFTIVFWCRNASYKEIIWSKRSVTNHRKPLQESPKEEILEIEILVGL